MDDVNRYAKVIWDYMLMHHQLKKADGILVCGAKDTRGAKYAADLFLQGYAPWLICSGGKGRITKDFFEKTEAETCADIAIERGVPKEKIISENQSTSTFENAVFTRRVLEEKGLDLKTCILVHKPYMERRAHATFRAWWPEKEWIVTSPPIPFDEYAIDDISKDLMINGMVGDIQRIRIYGEKWWQVPQEIPSDVQSAYEELVRMGFNKQLLKEDV